MSQISSYPIPGGGGGSGIQTLTGNTGGPIPPDAFGDIALLGSGNILSTGNALTNTITFTFTGILPIANGGTAVDGTAYITDGTFYFDGFDFVTTATGNLNDVLTSNGPGVAPSYQPLSSSGAVISLTADTGPAVVPTAGNINVFGGTAARDINTSGAGSTIHIDLNNAITLGDLSSIVGSPAITLTTGDATLSAGNVNLPNTSGAGTAGEITFGGNRWISNFGATNTFVGQNSGNTTTIGFSSVGIGTQALQSMTTGVFNTCTGFLCGSSLTSGTNNSAYGSGAFISAVTTSQNTVVGSSALNNAVSPTSNTVLGFNAATNYTTNESNNIIIGSSGVIGDNRKIRIGFPGVQNATFIVGIDGVNVGSVATVVTESGNQLGTAVITAGSGITITPSANAITIAASGVLTYTNVNTTPYVVLASDEYLSVDSSGMPITIQLPNTTTTARVITIKDRTASAAANNITVTTVGGVVNIDGTPSFIINTNHESVQVIWSGSAYEIF